MIQKFGGDGCGWGGGCNAVTVMMNDTESVFMITCIFIKVAYCSCNFFFFLPLNVTVYIIIFYNVLSWSISLHC